jgi:hypothetical protein
MCGIDGRPDPVQRTIFIDEFANWHGELEKLVTHCKTLSDPALRSAVCLGVGSIPADRLAPPDVAAWKPVISTWYQTAPDITTHSAGWVMRRWKIDLPAVPHSSQPRRVKKEKFEGREPYEWRLSPQDIGYRLPTEAEWEYACRAGTTTDFACGSDQELLRKYAVFQTSGTEPVGGKLPNAWRLFDMHGNKWEWCYDWHAAYAAGGVSDPAGPSEQPPADVSYRIHRGGNWAGVARNCRSADRGGKTPTNRRLGGFRVARSSVQ